MSDGEMRDKDEADNLDPAFDSIDATMKDATRRDVAVTPEALADIVNDAVAKAILAYEQSRAAGLDPAAARPAGAAMPKPSSNVQPRDPAAVPPSPWRAKIEQLKDDMGLDEIEFDGPRPEPVEVVVQRQLSRQMGVNDFEFEDAQGQPAAPDAPARTTADAVAGWGPSADPAPAPPLDVAEELREVAEMREVEEMRAAATSEKQPADLDDEFDWVAEELKRLETEDLPEPAPALSESAPALTEPAPALSEPAPAPAPEVVATVFEAPAAAPPSEALRQNRGVFRNWFRSAFGEEPTAGEADAAVPHDEPAAVEAPSAAAPAPQPEPEPEAPAPIAATPVQTPSPEAADAADAIRFTFDPIPPLPPPLPREPKAPPRKVNKFGRFL